MVLAVLPLVLAALSCSRSVDPPVPAAICGTRIDPSLSGLLLPAVQEVREVNRVDRSHPTFAPCVLLSGHDPVLELQFSWDASPPDLMYLAQGAGSISHISQPRPIDFARAAVIGTDGAIAQAACKTQGGNYFTLTLQLPQVKLADQSHRADIENFMRAYFPATLATLGCVTSAT
ncbi:hypothetical protein ACWDU8_04390 [Streptomyces sp. NPDC003388]|uniref:hypothetical protein n=1 Tax=unclassified Streptomyces TaxID=2593676 RepID=UPI0024824ED9|nr:hypothetical protein [Streptomyces sp. ATE26]MDI1456115.1 hypothetical protein [Streptomyces sp. ATE26]